MAPIFEDGNNKKDPPREDDLFYRSSLATVALALATVLVFWANHTPKLYFFGQF